MGTRFTIVRGADRASLLACLRGPPDDVALPPPTGRHPSSCRAFDVAVHAFGRCGTQVPLSLHAELDGARVRLGNADPDDAERACAAALDVVQRVDARRTELGWECREHEHARAPIVSELDASTLVVDHRELVHFVDDHTLVMVAGESYNTPDPGVLVHDLRAFLARPRAPHWSDDARARLDPRRAVWIALRPLAMLEGESAAARADLPSLVAGTLDLHDGMTAELRLVGASALRVLELRADRRPPARGPGPARRDLRRDLRRAGADRPTRAALRRRDRAPHGAARARIRASRMRSTPTARSRVASTRRGPTSSSRATTRRRAGSRSSSARHTSRRPSARQEISAAACAARATCCCASISAVAARGARAGANHRPLAARGLPAAGGLATPTQVAIGASGRAKTPALRRERVLRGRHRQRVLDRRLRRGGVAPGPKATASRRRARSRSRSSRPTSRRCRRTSACAQSADRRRAAS